MIAAVWGLMLGAGVVLAASPWLWPTRAGGVRRFRRSPLHPLEPLRVALAQAGLTRLSPAGVVVVSFVVGIAAGSLVLALAPVAVLAAAAALAATAAPFAVILGRARSRRREMRAVWPDAIDHLVAGIRSGTPLGEALCELGESGPAPLRPAFAGFTADFRGTGQLMIALDELKERMADPVADRVIETMRLAREVGGSELPAVLRALAAHLRADAAIRSEVEGRQTWVVSAARLGVAAPWLVLLLLAARPEGVRAYNSPLGAVVLLLGFGVTVVAYRIMLALGRLPAERRWFA